MDLAANERRFLDGLATSAAIDRAVLDRAGTTVIGRDDRADSGALACYRAGAHLVVWGDPAVVDRVADLNDPAALAASELTSRLTDVGFNRLATVISNMLDRTPPPLSPIDPGYVQIWLDGDDPATVDHVRAFTERCDPVEVEHAALDELDDYDEAAINVLTPSANPSPGPANIVAYASASPWFWDPTMADIGVLVHAEHRRRGLASLVVASTVERLLADDRIPFYRHELSNVGSAAVAAGLGFKTMARLDYFVLDEDAMAVGPPPDD